jgi:hypothetical protein
MTTSSHDPSSSSSQTLGFPRRAHTSDRVALRQAAQWRPSMRIRME